MNAPADVKLSETEWSNLTSCAQREMLSVALKKPAAELKELDLVLAKLVISSFFSGKNFTLQDLGSQLQSMNSEWTKVKSGTYSPPSYGGHRSADPAMISR